jgi:hypothetical protein
MLYQDAATLNALASDVREVNARIQRVNASASTHGDVFRSNAAACREGTQP